MSARQAWKQLLGYPDGDRAVSLLGELTNVADITCRDGDNNICNLEDAVYLTIASRRMLHDEAERIKEVSSKQRYEDKHPTRHRHKSDINPTLRSQKSEVRSQKSEVPPISPKGGPTIDLAFEKFWVLYPRKKGKAAAYKAWCKEAKHIAEVQSAITKALVWQRTQPGWLKDEGQFIPHPATWLNQRRWMDEPDDVNLPGPSKSPEQWMAEIKEKERARNNEQHPSRGHHG